MNNSVNLYSLFSMWKNLDNCVILDNSQQNIQMIIALFAIVAMFLKIGLT